MDLTKGTNAKSKSTNGDSNPQQNNVENSISSTNGFQVYKRMRPKQGFIGITDKNPLQISKELSKSLGEQCKEITLSVDGFKKSPIHMKRTRSISQKIERNLLQLRKSKSELIKSVTESVEGTERNVELRKVKSDSNKVNVDLIEVIEKNSSGIFDENVNGFDSCEEKVITGGFHNVGSDEIEDQEEMKTEIDDEIKKQSMDIKIEEEKANKVVIEEKKIHSISRKEFPVSQNEGKQIHPKIVPKPAKSKPIPVADEFKTIPKTHNKLQSLVDLIMWRDVSKSAFIFGLGTFTLVSSSYTNDLNISLISVVSYIGLVYLAIIFLFRSIICRGGVDFEDKSEEEYYVIGEEEAAWLLKMILPYFNELLLKLKSLFSGDPSTTMKLAVLLFILARCGSSITIWKMAKLGFFGVFTVPKICSSYSTQLTAHGTFWIERLRYTWESCSHKKAVLFAIFTFLWNMSSILVRTWAVFMVIVGFKYYQHCMMQEKEEEEEEEEDCCQSEVVEERQKSGPTTSTTIEIKRKKKR